MAKHFGPCCVKCCREFKGLMRVMQNENTGQWICVPCWQSLSPRSQSMYGGI